jgi:hypothetical protein
MKRRGILLLSYMIEHFFDNNVKKFILSAISNELKMILVGGVAVNYYGYQRHSADIDFWIQSTPENFEKLILVLNDMGFHLDELPQDVLMQKQNISLKVSPVVEIELITAFNFGVSFEEAYENSRELYLDNLSYRKWNIISFEDLIKSKITSDRTKDKLDIIELQRIKNK